MGLEIDLYKGYRCGIERELHEQDWKCWTNCTYLHTEETGSKQWPLW